MGKRRDFIFGDQVDHIKSQPMDNKPSLEGAWSRHVANFKFWETTHNSGTTEATVDKFCTYVGSIYMTSINFGK